MRLLLCGAVIVILLGLGGYRLAQDSRVRELFDSSDAAGNVKPKPANSGTVQRPSGAETKPASASAGARRKAAMRPPAAPARKNPPAPQNQIDNGTVARVLLQILAAKKLDGGISLSVSDAYVSVSGTTDSEESRKKILEIIEKGREARKIDARGLIVGTSSAPGPPEDID